jgi:phenylacetate-CoA ligase
MAIIDTIYFNSPIWAQQLYVALYGGWWYWRRFGKDFQHFVTQLEARERWGEDQFRVYQEERLRALFKIAWRSPYYLKVFSKAGITLEMQPLETLSRVPLLTKETVRLHGRDLLTVKSIPRGTFTCKSSGTTGTPTEIFYTRKFHQLAMAWFEARSRRWAGLNFKDRRAMFGVRKVCGFEQSRPPFWRFSPLENLAYMSIYHLSPKFMPAYIDFLHEFRPKLVMGYPNALSTLSSFAIRQGTLPPAAQAVITTSETVTPSIRKAIETAWQCKLYDTYGAVEACVYASECEHGRLHLNPDIGIYEILDHEGNPCPTGVIGEGVCTGLHNLLQPLIRYRIGDVAMWSTEQECPCGRNMPILQSIEGRIEDMCYTADGRAMLRFDTVFKGVNGIRQAQVVQEEINKFIINVIPHDVLSKYDREMIKSNMRLHVGDVRVEVQEVPLIPLTAGNKFRAVISKLTHEEVKAIQSRGITRD